jgi:hypothetical protein
VATSAGRAKRDREKARQERQALKRARRLAPREAVDEADPSTDGGSPPTPPDQLLERLADLHQQFADGKVGFEEFEEAKEALIRDLTI